MYSEICTARWARCVGGLPLDRCVWTRHVCCANSFLFPCICLYYMHRLSCHEVNRTGTRAILGHRYSECTIRLSTFLSADDVPGHACTHPFIYPPIHLFAHPSVCTPTANAGNHLRRESDTANSYFSQRCRSFIISQTNAPASVYGLLLVLVLQVDYMEAFRRKWR